ncbi:MAG: hypothetical protein JWO05_2461 [Gemmatimonadetes bacterium]|nr:hypothetical protein [Gemmatimonadota bacterium]
MPSISMRRRQGFTLIELMMSMVILAVIGVAFTRLILSQARFFDRNYAKRQARQVGRNSINLLTSDLRMVQDSGGVTVAAANGKSITVIVPYWYGLVCSSTGGTLTASMLPVDSATKALATYNGYAYRNAAGRYVIVQPSNPLSSDAPAASASTPTCTGNGSGQAQLATLTLNGRAGSVMEFKPGNAALTAGTPIFAFQKITYAFASSTTYSGRVALWRQPEGGTNEELIAPFDTSSRFRFWITGTDTSQVTVPTLDKIRGLDLVLNGAAVNTLVGDASVKQSKLTTAVYFKNVRSF